MGHGSSLLNRAFTPCDSFQDGKPSLRVFVSLDIDKVRSRTPVLSNKNWVALGFKLSDDVGSVAL